MGGCVDEIEEKKGFRLIYHVCVCVCVCVCVYSHVLDPVDAVGTAHELLELVGLCVCVCVCVCVYVPVCPTLFPDSLVRA